MGNVIESFASGFGKSIRSLLQGPLDFLSGKSCSSVCGPTLDLLCYVENFCVANLLKLGLILISGYIVKMLRACFAACFYTCKHGCHCCFHKLLRRRGFHGESIGNFVDPNRRNGTGSFMNHRPRVLSRGHLTREQRKGRYVKRSLRVRNRRVRVGIFGRDYRRSDRHYPTKKRRSHGNAVYDGDHGVMVTRTRLAHKGRWV